MSQVSYSPLGYPESVTIESRCTCENEDGSESKECWGMCAQEAQSDFEWLMNEWKARHDDATDVVRVTGRNIGWQHLAGYAIVSIDRIRQLLEAHECRVEYELSEEDGELSAVRHSHDEPTGAFFTFEFVSEDEEQTF